jgi:hypothetical protein
MRKIQEHGERKITGIIYEFQRVRGGFGPLFPHKNIEKYNHEFVVFGPLSRRIRRANPREKGRK